MDGDTDSKDVQTEFTKILLEEMEKAEAIAAMPTQPPRQIQNGPRTGKSTNEYEEYYYDV